MFSSTCNCCTIKLLSSHHLQFVLTPTRHLVLVSQAVALLPSSPVVDGVKAWIQAQLAWMDSGEQGAEARSACNNVEIWYHALVSSTAAVQSFCISRNPN